MLDACKGKGFASLRDEALIRLYANTGARLSEVGNLFAAHDDWPVQEPAPGIELVRAGSVTRTVFPASLVSRSQRPASGHASPDLLRARVKTFAEALMSAEVDAVRGAPYVQRSDERVNSRNGWYCSV